MHMFTHLHDHRRKQTMRHEIRSSLRFILPAASAIEATMIVHTSLPCDRTHSSCTMGASLS
jgi:hypothetical protein